MFVPNQHATCYDNIMFSSGILTHSDIGDSTGKCAAGNNPGVQGGMLTQCKR